MGSDKGDPALAGADGASATALQPPPHLLTTLPHRLGAEGGGGCVCPVGLASELTSRGASTTDVMLAGNWKTSRMVAHYSAGATAERGAGRAGFYAPPRRSQRTEWYNPVPALDDETPAENSTFQAT